MPKPEPGDFSPEGKPLQLDPLLPQQVGQTKERWGRVADAHRYLMRLLSLQEALVLLRERWQMELRYKLWKHYGRIAEWQTANRWRILCERYAKLIGLLLHHWLVILFAQAGMNSAVWSSWREARSR